MVLFVLYAISTAAVLWSTLFYLPYPEITQHVGFALNIVFLGFLSLLSFLAFRQELHFRSIFYQFWLLFCVSAVAGPLNFHVLYFLGDAGAFIAYVLTLVILHSLFLWVTAKTVFAYIFHDEKRWAINLLSALLVLPVSAWLFWPFWWSPEHLMNLPTWSELATKYKPLYNASAQLNIVTLLLQVAFFWHKLKTDRPLGAYADTMMFAFGLYVLVDTVDLFCQITTLELANITMLASAGILVGMCVTLILRLKYKSQSIAQYYESQLLSHDSRIDRRIGWFDRFILRSFFDPEKVGESIYLGANPSKVSVKRTSHRVERTLSRD